MKELKLIERDRRARPSPDRCPHCLEPAPAGTRVDERRDCEACGWVMTWTSLKCTVCQGGGLCRRCTGNGCRYCSGNGDCPSCTSFGFDYGWEPPWRLPLDACA